MGQREYARVQLFFRTWGYEILKVHEIWHLPQSSTTFFNTFLKIKLADIAGPLTRGMTSGVHPKLWSPRRGPPLDYSTWSRLDGIPLKIERKSCQTHLSQTHVKELLGKIRLAVQQISSGNLHFPRQVLTTSRQWRNSNPQRESGQSLTAGGSLQQHWKGKAIQPNIFIAWFTTCHAFLRLYWLGLSVLNPEEVIYMDTDSIVYKRRPGVPELPTGLYLGQFKDELDGNDVIPEFAATGLINYGSIRVA